MKNLCVLFLALWATSVLSEELSFSGYVEENAIEYDYFGADVTVGDPVYFYTDLDLSSVPTGATIPDLSLFNPNILSGSATIYQVPANKALEMNIGAANVTGEAGITIVILNNYSTTTDYPVPVDIWSISSSKTVGSNDVGPTYLGLGVSLISEDTSFIENTEDFFIPDSLVGLTAEFGVSYRELEYQGNGFPETVIRRVSEGPIVAINQVPPEVLLHQLVEQVGLLEGSLPGGLNRSYGNKIGLAMNALSMAKAGSTQSAIGSLRGFIASVHAQAGKFLTEEQASELIELAEQAIELLQAN